ncbi:hypothetical protein TWF506_004552 [Arthrobotrys conoides]|uniref:Uncharacterized protein n=1 Tax=Arthrobotrys conoides TaxID=74498 RepID=A0AAN8NEX6_9PEZI
MESSEDDDDPLINQPNSAYSSSSYHHRPHRPHPTAPVTPATIFALGQNYPSQAIDSEDYIYSTINPLLTLSSHDDDYPHPPPLPPIIPVPPVASVAPDTVSTTAPDFQEDSSHEDVLPSVDYENFDYGSILGDHSLGGPVNDTTSPIDNHNALGQYDIASTSRDGAAVGFQLMPPPVQPASALRILQRPRPRLHPPHSMNLPFHQSPQQPMDRFMDPCMNHFMNPYWNPYMNPYKDMPMQPVHQLPMHQPPMHQPPIPGFMPNLIPAHANDERSKNRARVAEMTVRFPPDMIPLNYTIAPEANLSRPLNIVEMIGEECDDEPDDADTGADTGADAGDEDERDEGGTELVSSTATSAVSGSHPRPQDTRTLRQQPNQKPAQKKGKSNRRERYGRRRKELVERRFSFLGLRERHQMYFAQDMRNECRSSGLDDPENPWFRYNFNAELKGYINEGKRIMSELPEPPKHIFFGSMVIDLNFLDSDSFSAGSDDTGTAPDSSAHDNSAVNLSQLSIADRIIREQDEKEKIEIKNRFYILRAIPSDEFNTRVLDPRNPDLAKSWGYLRVIRKIYQARLPPCLKYFLYKELDIVQGGSFRGNSHANLADRIESLEWDIRDFMRKGEIQVAQNVRMVVRDYRAGFIKLPTEGSCILYHDGKLLGYFTPNRLFPFLYPFLERTTGPVWKEDGNQPKPVPEVYMRSFAQMFPNAQPQLSYCAHGVLFES